MDQSPTELLNDAKKLLDRGKHSESYDTLERILQIENLPIEIHLEALLYKSTVLWRLEKFNESIKLSKYLIPEFNRLNKPIQSIIASLNIATVFLIQSNFQESLIVVTDAEKTLEKLTNIDGSIITSLESRIVETKTIIYGSTGKYEEALSTGLKGLSIAQKNGNKFVIAIWHNNLGNIYSSLGQLDASIDSFKQGLAITEQIDHEDLKWTLLNNIGLQYLKKGDLNKALSHFQDNLVLRKDSKNNLGKSSVMNYLGSVYLERGELKEAIYYLKQSLAIRKEIGNKPYIADTLNQISRYYHMMGNVSEALNYLSEANMIYRELGDNVHVAILLSDKIKILLETTNTENIIQYLSELSNFVDKEKNAYVSLAYKEAKAYYLKITSNRAIQRSESQLLFAEIANDTVINDQSTIFALLNWGDLLFQELKVTCNEEILHEIKEVIERLDTLAKSQNRISLSIEIFMLKSQLALVIADIEQAKNLLDQAQEIAEDYGLRRLAMQISHQYDILLKEHQNWDQLSILNAPLKDRLKTIPLDNLFQNLIRRKDQEDQQEKPEIPVSFSIMTLSGHLLYSKILFSEIEKNNNLLSLLHNSLAKFCINSNIKENETTRIKIEDYFILISRRNSILFCYMFIGQSYSSKQKLEAIIDALEANKGHWNELMHNTDKLSEHHKNSIDLTIDSLLGDISRNESSTTDSSQKNNEYFADFSSNITSQELMTYKNLFHPARLLIMKHLSHHIRVSATELKEFLGIGWGAWASHIMALEKEDLIESRKEFVDEAPRVIIYLKSKGNQQYHEFSNILKTVVAT